MFRLTNGHMSEPALHKLAPSRVLFDDQQFPIPVAGADVLNFLGHSAVCCQERDLDGYGLVRSQAKVHRLRALGVVAVAGWDQAGTEEFAAFVVQPEFRAGAGLVAFGVNDTNLQRIPPLVGGEAMTISLTPAT